MKLISLIKPRLIRQRMNTINGANDYTRSILNTNTGISNHIGHFSKHPPLGTLDDKRNKERQSSVLGQLQYRGSHRRCQLLYYRRKADYGSAFCPLWGSKYVGCITSII